MKSFIEALFLPPGLFVLVGVISLALCSRWTGRLLFVLNLSALYLLSTPVVGTYLMRSLEPSEVVSEAEIQAFRPQVILVPMSSRSTQAPEYGGQTVDSLSLERLRYAAYLQQRTGIPILLADEPKGEPGPSPAELGRRVLEREFQLSTAAVETADDVGIGGARASERLPERIRGRRVLLVTHAWQMRQLGDRLRAQGQEVLGAPTLITPPLTNARDPQHWMPRLWALGLSTRGMQQRWGELSSRLASLLG
jgi:uncharacterized SAM-binding protein YcdF (DUF218 family)